MAQRRAAAQGDSVRLQYIVGNRCFRFRTLRDFEMEKMLDEINLLRMVLRPFEKLIVVIDPELTIGVT